MNWAEDGSIEIGVFGEPEIMVPLALEISELSGGRFERKPAE